MILSIPLLIFIFLSDHCNSSVIINRYDENDYKLDQKLVEEIASYKNTAKHIMEEINQTWGPEMYKQYSLFIDKFGARPSGTDVLERAIDHILNLTQAAMIENGELGYSTEEVEVPRWARGNESLVMKTPRQKNIAIIGLGYSVSTPKEGITAEAIVISSFNELDKMDINQIQGKIVVFDEQYTNYGETVRYRSEGATKASEKGAVAALINSVTPFSLYTPHTGAQFYGDKAIKIPTAAITHEDADLLRRLQNNGDKVELTLKMFSTLEMKKSRNTIIELRGSEKPDKQVIVSGHIDSWDVGQGAMDDGGGMMISWFAPVVLSRLGYHPRRTLRAILWTAEELGLIGAQKYLNKHEHELSNINFIMETDEGTFAPQGLTVAGSKKARVIIKEVLKIFSPIDKYEETDYPGSDIVLFVNKGVPGASLLNKNERYFWYHHSEADTMDVQNMTDVVNCAAFWAAVPYVIADLSVDIPRE